MPKDIREALHDAELMDAYKARLLISEMITSDGSPERNRKQPAKKDLTRWWLN